MSFTTEKTAQHPTTGETCRLERASVWIVDESRGDLYVVAFEHKDVLIRLLDGGIVNRSRDALNVEMDVMVNELGNVIALPLEVGDGWSRCKRLRD